MLQPSVMERSDGRSAIELEGHGMVSLPIPFLSCFGVVSYSSKASNMDCSSIINPHPQNFSKTMLTPFSAGGHDAVCKQCQRGQFQMCQNGAVNGVTMDGGYAEYVLLRTEAVVKVPTDVDPVEYAPILCAGITVFNSIRKLHITPGELVAVQGLGGLGHLAVQYANKMGYQVAALSSGDKKRDFAKKLGAHEYIDASKDDPCKKLMELGGAALIVCTAPNPKAISPLTGGLAPGGKLLVLSPCGPIEINSADLISKMASVAGFPSGHALDSEEAIAFTKLHGIKCMVEKFPLKEVQKAFDHMMSGDVRFRSVLVME